MISENQEPEKQKEPEFNVEEGSAEITLQDVYKMLYVLVRQSQKAHPGSKMSFDLKVFKALPKKLQMHFLNKQGRLFVWIPETAKDRKKKSKLYLPEHNIITRN